MSTKRRKNTLALYRHWLNLTLLVTLSACLPHSPDGQTGNTAQTPNAFWKPPAAPTPSRLTKEPALPENLETQRLGLGEVLDVALCNNPVTKASWADAQAAAAGYGSSQAAYLPTVNMAGSVAVKETTTVMPKPIPRSNTRGLALIFHGCFLTLEAGMLSGSRPCSHSWQQTGVTMRHFRIPY